MAEHHPVFSKFRPYSGVADSGFEVDYIGTRTRREFCPEGGVLPERTVHMSYPPVDEEYFEWVDVLESVLAARNGYTMFELGAGYGRWLVRAAAALRQRGPIPCRLVAVEPEPQHFRWLKNHLRDNGIDPEEHTLIEAAVADQAGEVLFSVGLPGGGKDQPNEWYGQTIIKSRTAVADAAYGCYQGAVVSRLKSGWKCIRVRTVRLPDLLRNFELIDLVDLDVQGEELRVISSAISELNDQAKRLHIGTHSRRIEAGLRRLLRRNGWECLVDYAWHSRCKTPWGEVCFEDGVQSWINPRLG